ncbi:MFS transporter [Pseudoglutamicibacter cumminsii]|nr:MFS transporter [Pseudoglutamicibacter cumminsii]MCT1686564.1 MFS transporter [Pseudoglutamicibacter cumminsii]
MSRMFASLQIKNYRWWFFGGLVSNIGTWMQRIAQDWLVLTQLTDNSGTAVGVVMGLQFLPILFLSAYAGVMADRYPRLRIVQIAQAFMCVLAVVLGVMVLTETVELWHVYVFATLLGVGAAFDAPARQALVNDLVPSKLVPNAVSLNSTSFNSARLIGPGVSGLLIAAVGTGWVFLLNAASFAGVLLSLFVISRNMSVNSQPRVPRQRGQVVEGIKYVAQRPTLIMIMVLAFVVGSFGLNFPVFNSVMATTVFDADAEVFGLLGTIQACGTLAGALMAARRQGSRLKFVVGGAIGFGITVIAACVAPWLWLYAVLLIPTGWAAVTFLNSCNVTLQMTVDPRYRGRVMALYMVLVMGGTPLGAPLMGWLAEILGARASVFLAGLISLVAGLWGLWHWNRHAPQGELRRRVRRIRVRFMGR